MPDSYSLNKKQLHLLALCYKFRFVTAPLLASYKNQQSKSLHKSLEILVKHGHLGKRYDSSYRLANRAAEYYLLPKALAVLKEQQQFNPCVLHAMYKNRSVGQAFVEHHLAVLEIYLQLRTTYPNTFNMFTKSELAGDDLLPESKPDLLLSRVESAGIKPAEYYLELQHDTQLFIIKKRFAALLEHYEGSGYGDGEYPTLLFVFDSGTTEKRFQEYASKLLESRGVDDLIVQTSTTKAIANVIGSKEIWTATDDDQELYGL